MTKRICKEKGDECDWVAFSRSLEADIRRLRRDKERLDWLEKSRKFVLGSEEPVVVYGTASYGDRYDAEYCPRVRAAIDAAMKAEKKAARK